MCVCICACACVPFGAVGVWVCVCVCLREYSCRCFLVRVCSDFHFRLTPTTGANVPLIFFLSQPWSLPPLRGQISEASFRQLRIKSWRLIDHGFPVEKQPSAFCGLAFEGSPTYKWKTALATNGLRHSRPVGLIAPCLDLEEGVWGSPKQFVSD